MRTIEAQFDPKRLTVTLSAQTDFAGDRYVTTVPAATQAEADQKARDFAAMYRNIEQGG